VRRWGSYSGADANEGRLSIGPFAAPTSLQFYVSGYPSVPGNEIYAEHVASKTRVTLDVPNAREHWRVAVVTLPRAWEGQPIVLGAVDGAKAWGGWLALSEPMRGGAGEPVRLFTSALAAWAINAVLLGALWLAAAAAGALRPTRAALDPADRGGDCSAAGYALGWIYFADPELGRTASLGCSYPPCSYCGAGQPDPGQPTARCGPLGGSRSWSARFTWACCICFRRRSILRARGEPVWDLPTDNSLPISSPRGSTRAATCGSRWATGARRSPAAPKRLAPAHLAGDARLKLDAQAASGTPPCGSNSRGSPQLTDCSARSGCPPDVAPRGPPRWRSADSSC